MNIMYLNNSVHLGGDTKCILKLCRSFKEDNNIVVVSRGGVLKEDIERMGIKHYFIRSVKSKSPVNILNNIITLINILKKEEIHIIHSHHRMTTLLAKIASKFTGVRVVHTQHLCIKDKFKLTKLALRNIETIAVSEAAKRILVEKSGLEGERITTIYNTVELETQDRPVDPRLLELKSNGYFIAAQVSRVIGYKGVYDFVEIAKRTIKLRDNIRFVLIGDGPEAERLREYIHREGLEEYVHMLGSKDNVIEHLKYIDLLLLCSYIEGLPLTPIEAFSQRIPVVATNIDGTNEEVTEGYNGYLVKTKDVQAFADKVIEIYEDREALEKLKANAYETYLSKFNAETYVKKHEDIYLSLLSKK
jgi:L-malate glycosyltransferase